MTNAQNPRYRLALEDMEPGHWIAYALDLPGCYQRGETPDEAVAGAPAAIAAYFAWRAEQDCAFPIPGAPIVTELVETFHSFNCRTTPGYVVNATFADDLRPLAAWEVQSALRVAEWTRRDLDSVIQKIPPAQRAFPAERPAGRKTSADLLRHIAGAENWYFSQFGLAVPRETLPVDPIERLAVVRANSRTQLREFAGNTRLTVAADEQWTARKIVRRMLWHERDHTQQIARQLLTTGD
jgi:predicted RNase H-like HicB family nuclease